MPHSSSSSAGPRFSGEMVRPSHSDHVLQQLNNQREWGFLCDCLIAIGDIYFRAHKAVLAACSSYFRMMFIRDQQGGGRLDLSNMQISAECFDLILQLMYLGRIVVGSYEFEELKASMVYLQMYYIPDSLEDLRDIRSSNVTPSSSASSSLSSSSSTGPVGGKMMFGVRICEKLLIEHILTCTNRKAYHPPRSNAEADNDSSKAESSASESVEEHKLICKGEEDWPETKVESDLAIRSDGGMAGTDREPGTRNISIKTDPEESMFPEIEVVRIGEQTTRDCNLMFSDATQNDLLREKRGLDRDPEPTVSSMEDSSEESVIPADLHKVKDEKPGVDCAPCELCGALLTEEDKSTHYLSSHMGHICACGRCGQVLIKGRQLQEHAERCGESHGGESDSHGEDEASLLEESQGMEEGLLEASDLTCPHCGLLCQSESLALEHTLTCHEQEMFRPALLEEGSEPDHRRKHFCSICGKGFYQRCHLREHYTVHTKEKQFTCQTCGKQFLRERQLRLHTDMHKGMARYVCPVCDQGTFLKHDHVRHMISHLSAGETICQVCFQIFPGGDQLEKHMDVHLYICGICGEKFRLRKDMRSHYNSKHTKRL
ncbi:hypothetical protein LDENG_00205560 [Lucifuga dentata]|nr:hypothetical protein LDENG_00205560 [Lucifuga dentata]